MALLLGVDTGGTYTDAVLLQDEKHVIASAKSLTTKENLALGVGDAIDQVLQDSGVDVSDIAMVSLSTTLATNALVEGQGGRVCLVLIGFNERDLSRQGLQEALQGDPVIFVNGGHDHSGAQKNALDELALNTSLDKYGDEVSGFAVASQFATRNPGHEIRARDIIREKTSRPVSCSHDLSAKLNGPKRAMTALLNARLIGMIDNLIGAVENLMIDKSIEAPFMVVRGDGALISADQARVSPIETILSGPAASIVGARWLTDENDAIVSDIGGTTTDIAILKDGRPIIDPLGAKVGPFRTMVEAVAMRTTGLGGDSQVHLVHQGLKTTLFLGPRRILPISLLAVSWPELVHHTLDTQLSDDVAGEYHGRFVLPVITTENAISGLSDREQKVLARIGERAQPLGAVLTNRMDQAALQALIRRGIVILSGVTPSDASHALGLVDVWDNGAAIKALELFSKQRMGNGLPIGSNATDLAQKIIDQLTEQTVDALLETAFAEDDFDFGLPENELARHVLTKKGLDQHSGLVTLRAGLNLPIIGLGASAHNYYGAVGKRVSAKTIIPDHAGVANAIGAVVGQISMRVSGQITTQGESSFFVHYGNEPIHYKSQEKALNGLENTLRDQATLEAQSAGAQGIRIRVKRDIKTAEIEGRVVFVEAEITVIATGRPRIAN